MLPADKKEELLKRINPELIEFTQKKMLVMKRPIVGLKVLQKPITHDDIKEALKAEGINCKSVIFYKVLGITGIHHIIVDGIKMLLKVDASNV